MITDPAVCTAYPPGPTWAIKGTASSDSYFVYCAQNQVVILDAATLQFRRAFVASVKKLHAIAMHADLCITGGEETVLRVWNINLDQPVLTFAYHTHTITAIQYIPSRDLVVSGDSSGRIVVQSITDDKRSVQTKVNAEICALEAIRYNDADYIAIGYKSGEIFVEQIQNDLSLARQFQFCSEANDNQIETLSWQYSNSETEKDWPLLASTAKNAPDVTVWDVAKESILCLGKRPPPASNITQAQRANLYSVVTWCPVYRNRLYCSVYQGLILCYEVDRSKKKAIIKDKFSQNHTRVIYTMTWVSSGGSMVTTSMDNCIIKWDMRRRDKQVIIRGQQSFGYSLDTSAHQPNMLAVGLGRGNIRIWNYRPQQDTSVMGKTRYSIYDTELHWKGLKPTRHIKNVVWHPHREDVLLYTTDKDGVGLYFTKDKRAVECRTHHKEGSRCMAVWCSDFSKALNIPNWKDTFISCGLGNELFVFDANHPNQPPIDLNERLAEVNPEWYQSLQAKGTTDGAAAVSAPKGVSRCCVAVDDAFRVMALGSTDGSVEVYALDTLRLVYLSHFFLQPIQTLRWQRQESDFRLAVASTDDTRITIHCIDASLPDTSIPVPQQTALQTFTGHALGITDLRWHPYTSPYLASSSEDGTVFVWDVDAGIPIAHFTLHLDAVFSVCWDMFHPSTLFSTGKDQFVFMWDMEHFHCSRNTKASRPSALLGVENKTSKKKRPVASVDRIPKKPKTTGNILNGDRAQWQQQCFHMAADLLDEEPSVAMQWVLEHTKNIPNIDTSAYVLKDKDVLDIDCVFGSKVDILQAVQNGYQYGIVPFIASPDNVYTLLSLNTKSVTTAWISIAMSPAAGKEAWLQNMRDQAAVLNEKGEYHLSVGCYLACSQVYDAINVYRQAGMYKDAILTAKLRLPTPNELISSLFGEWARQLQTTDQEELAAMCMVQSKTSGALVNAIHMLGRSHRSDALFWSACMARLSKDTSADTLVQEWLSSLSQAQGTVE